MRLDTLLVILFCPACSLIAVVCHYFPFTGCFVALVLVFLYFFLTPPCVTPLHSPLPPSKSNLMELIGGKLQAVTT